MAPVLFLFLMAALVEIIDKEWARNQIECVELCRESDETYEAGQIFKHNIKKCNASTSLVRFRINGTYYVDDIASLFRSRRDPIVGMPIIQSILSDLGMEMHVGKMIEGARSKSKTECIYFPPSDYFKKLRLQAGTNGLELELATQGNDENLTVDENLYLNRVKKHLMSP